LNAKIAAFAQALGELEAEIASVPRGALGAPVVGEGEVNLAALMKSRMTVEALITLIGTRTEDFGETWNGFTALMRTQGKATEAEVKAAFRASCIVDTYPRLGALWASGDISGAQIRQIGAMVLKLPIQHREDAVNVLADHAPLLTCRELGQAGRVLLNAVSPGWEERAAERAEAESFLSISRDLTGYRLSGHLTDEQAGWALTVLDAHTGIRVAGEVRSRSQRQAEAFVTIMRQYANSKEIPQLAMAVPQVLIAIEARDFLAIANDAAPGDFAMTEWGDRLDPATTRRLMSDADLTPVLVERDDTTPGSTKQTLVDVALDAATAKQFTSAVKLLTKRRKSKEFAQRCAAPLFLSLLTAPVVPIAMGRKTRTINKPMRDAVMLRDQHCVVEGCEMPSHRCEIHHVKPWALGGPTNLDNLATLCIHHHRTVENGTWQLRRRTPADGPGHYWIAEPKY
jgi:hypothetical protein